MIVMVANAFVMNNAAAGAISVRPEAAGTAAGAMGFLQQGIGALVSQFGAYLGGHSTTTLPLTAAIFALSIACASAMFFLVPRGDGGGERGTDQEGGGGRERDVVRVPSDAGRLHSPPSSSAKAGDPVRRALSFQSLTALEYWVTRLRG